MEGCRPQVFTQKEVSDFDKSLKNGATLSSHASLHVPIKEEFLIFSESSDSAAFQDTLHQSANFSFNTTQSSHVTVPCVRCGEVFSSMEDLQNHESVCKHDKVHTCDVCQMKFELKADLEQHVVTHEINGPHNCCTCGTFFYTKEDLQNHLLYHVMEVPHVCSVCGTEFQRHSSLANHMKIHKFSSVQKMMACDLPVKCASATPNSSSSIIFKQSACDSKSSKGAIPSFETLSARGKSRILNFKAGDLSSNFMISYNQASSTALPSLENLDFLNENENSLNEEKFDVDHTRLTYASQMKKADKDLGVDHNGSTDLLYQSVKKHGLKYGIKMEEISLACDKSDSILEEGKEEEYFKALQDEGSSMNVNNNSYSSTEIIPLSHVEVSLENGHQVPSSKVASKHECLECPKKFPTKQKLYRHMWIHRKNQFSCETCGLVFNERNVLDEHRISSHPPSSASPFVCLECGKTFASRQSLGDHGRVHGGGANGSALWCHQCSKSFSSRQGFQIHIRTHTGEKPYGCKYCWKSFRDGGTLRKHERIHTGERPHVCPLCTKAFNQKVVLREHVRCIHVAAWEPLFSCQICNAVLSQKEEFCAHIVKHSDEIAAMSRFAAKEVIDSENQGKGKN